MSPIGLIGNLSVDRVAGGEPRPGGGVFHAARAAARLGTDVVVVTRCAPSDRAIARCAARDDDDVGPEARGGARSVEDTAARPRVTAGHPVDREVADQPDRAHARAAPAPTRPVAAVTARASPNETTKLGSVAPTLHAGGSRRCTCSTHHAGPVGESHW